jgi:uncharacterized protein YbjQ (UPF0145 family)
VAERDGQGMPPVERRIARFTRSELHTSLMSAQDAAALEAVGLDPVGDVMGCTVQRVSLLQTTLGPVIDYGPYAKAQRRGYETALDRLQAEAAALGADGVLGIRLSVDQRSDTVEEFVAMGTAVRARSTRRPKKPFTTDLSGPDVAKLLMAGWVPAALAFAVAVDGRYFGYQTQQQLSMLAGNFEIKVCTSLLESVRAAARTEFDQRVRRAGAEGAIVSALSAGTWSVGERGFAAQADVFGTALARFRQEQPVQARALTIMPLAAGRSTG